jgi:hypothetical protein
MMYVDAYCYPDGTQDSGCVAVLNMCYLCLTVA